MKENFEFAYSKNNETSENLTRINFFGKSEIIFTEDEIEELFQKLAINLDYEVRKNW